MTLHQKIRKLCAERRWTQATLRTELDVSKSTMSNWFRGFTKPDLDMSLRIARVLGVPLDYLADDEQDEPGDVPSRPALADDEVYVLRVYRSFRDERKLDENAAVVGLGLAAAGGTEPGKIIEHQARRFDEVTEARARKGDPLRKNSS